MEKYFTLCDKNCV